MTKQESFISKNQDTINAVGHTLNALQNAKLRDNQKKLAKISAINTALQQERVELNKQKVDLLEDQKEYFENKKEAEKQNALLKKLMLRTGPELEELTKSLINNKDSDSVYSDFIDAKFMLRFIKDNRGLIEDINYQRLINDQDKEINTLSKELNTRSKPYKELIFKTLQENVKYLHGLNVFYEASQENHNIDKGSLEEASQIIFDLHQNPVKSSILSESLRIVDQESLTLNELDFEPDFIRFAINITENVSDFQFYKENIIDRIEALKEQATVEAKKELKEYLKDKGEPISSKQYNFKGTNFKKVLEISQKINTFSEDDFEVMEDKDNLYGAGEYLSAYINVLFVSIQPYTHINKEKMIDRIQSNSSRVRENLKLYAGLEANGNRLHQAVLKLVEDIKKLQDKFPKDRTPRISHYNSKGNDSLKSSCFVVTATTGSPDNKIVLDFKNYRDEILINNFAGRVFVSTYYKIGPFLAKSIRKNQTLRKFALNYLILPIHQLIKTPNKNPQKNDS